MHHKTLIGFGVLALACTSPTQAGQIISGIQVGFAGGEFQPVNMVPSPGSVNNNVIAGVQPDPTEDGIQFAYTIDWTSTAPVVSTFDVRNSSGVTEYRMPVTFNNGSAQTWTGLAVEIGRHDTVNGFMPATFDGLDFDMSTLDQSGSDTPSYIVNGPNLISYVLPPRVRPQQITDAKIEVDATQFLNDSFGPNTTSHQILFAIDVPDEPAEGVWKRGDENYQFALRFTPIPEPATAFVLIVAAAMIFRRHLHSAAKKGNR